jgi:hypothetical protein
LGETLCATHARSHEGAAASLALPLQQTAAQMTRAELEQRLLELERRIEQSKTVTWLAERERDEALFELRRLTATESKELKP